MAEDKPESELDPLARSREQIRAEKARERIAPVSDSVMPEKTSGEQRNKNQFHSSYQNYLFSSAGEHEKPAWSDSTQGRLAIRLVSRGIVGATFFAVGGRISRTQLMNYDPEKIKFNWETASDRPLQLVAKGFDVVFGKPISGMSRSVAKMRGLDVAAQESAAWNAVNFRTKAYYHTDSNRLNLAGKAMNGRSLGAEMVAISFDFAMSSVGDASTRNFFQMIDPNIDKTWMVNDQGKMAKKGEHRHFSVGRFMRSTGVAAWRVLSKNQGEDWAAALPYVYQMKAQRGMMTHTFRKDLKGAKIMFDNAWNGAAYKINNEGKIIGDYQLAGAMDLQARFVGYNIYTLMFREGYDTIGNAFLKWKNDHYHIHLPKEVHPIDGTRKAVRYVVKSAIKGSMYMMPATIPFWLMRTPQTKWRGALIAAEAGQGINAIASKTRSDPHHAPLNEYTYVLNQDTAGGRIFPGSPEHLQPNTMFVGNREMPNPFADGGYSSPFDKRVYENYKPSVNTTFSKAINPLGKFSYWMGDNAVKVSHHLPQWMQKRITMEESIMMKPRHERKNIQQTEAGKNLGRETFMRNFMDASLSYTPYMFAKAEFGLRVDDHAKDGGPGRMDSAIYKLIDNVVAFKPRGIKNSLKEMWNLSTHIDHTLVSREGGIITPEKEAPTRPPAPTQIPTTIVQTKEAKRQEPVELSRDPDAEKKTDDRSWAESVAGRDLSAQFSVPDNQTRH